MNFMSSAKESSYLCYLYFTQYFHFFLVSKYALQMLGTCQDKHQGVKNSARLSCWLELGDFLRGWECIDCIIYGFTIVQ